MLLSVPIYDGFNIGQGALRGFVGTICCEEEVPQVKNFFTENLRSIQADLNHAIVDGAKNGSLDHLHTKTSALERTIESWRIFLRFLHNWSDVYFEPMSPSIDAGRVWWVEDDSVRIRVNSILDPESPIFRDKDISHEIEQLRSEWKDSVMVLMFPEFCESLDANDKYYYLQRRVKDVIEFLHLIILRIMLYIKEQQASNFAKTAAVGSVMARNMSHNFGSHVLARLSSRDSLIKATGLLENKEKGIGRIASLSSYLRTRMDFLADIVTSYERTATTMDLCQVRDFFEGQLLLLDHISGVNLRKKNIKVELQPEGSIYFACPNDFVGTHALFVIFENMIRNSAKHSEVVNEIVLTLRTEETMIKGNSLLKVLLYDNLGICRQKPELVATINDQIKGSVVDSEQRLRKGYWGVLEMKTAAMYLRRISLQEIDNNERVPEALKAVDVEGHLGYELYLEMPNEIAFVSCHVEPHWLAEKSGAWKLKTFEWGTNQLGSPEGLESYEYVVVADLDEHMMMAIDNSRGSLSKKLFVLDDLAHDVPHYMTTVATEDILNCSDREELLLFLERKWSEHQGKDQFIVNSTVRLARGKGDIIDLKRTEVEMPNVVFFDNHGDCYDDAARGRNMSAYYEPFSSTGSTSIVLQRLRQSEGKQGELLNLKLIGSANCRVAIIDERIQEIAFNDSDQQVTEVKLADILEKMNIFLPPLKDHTDHNIFFDLAYKDAKQYEVPLSRWLAEKASSGLDFLVIHIGIIEKLAGTDQNSIARWLADTQRIIGGHVTIVVVSGRGNPSNLPPGTRFVAYSNVARYVLEDHCKFQLVNILEQARNLDNE